MPLYDLDVELSVQIHKLVKKFPDNFGHINPDHILPVFVTDSPRGAPIAEVKMLPEWTLLYGHFHVAMFVYDENYSHFPDHVKNMIVLHELEHIAPHPFSYGKYRLKKHEVQDWQQMVIKMGPNWTEALRDMPEFNPLLSDETDWLTALDKMSMGVAAGHVAKEKNKNAKKTRHKRRPVQATEHQ